MELQTLKMHLRQSELGVDALGFVFFRESPRYIEPKKARAIINLLPSFVLELAYLLMPQKKKFYQ